MVILSKGIDRSGKTVILAMTKYGKISGAGEDEQAAIAAIEKSIAWREDAEHFEHCGPEIPTQPYWTEPAKPLMLA